MEQFRCGCTVGNGAAINIELGWIPDLVEVYNATDGTIFNRSWIGEYVVPFSDGGDTAEIVEGETITGATSGAEAIIKEILLYSGSWAAGDAAGFLVLVPGSLSGTFQSEQILGASGGGDATVTANVVHGYDSDTEIAADNTGITPYVGSAAAAAKGFTIASGLATEAKLLRWAAWRNG
jgi:hypothetical protein